MKPRLPGWENVAWIPKEVEKTTDFTKSDSHNYDPFLQFLVVEIQ